MLMIERVKTMIKNTFKTADHGCECNNSSANPCSVCVEEWMQDNYNDLACRYKDLHEPVRQQTIDRQMGLYQEFISE